MAFSLRLPSQRSLSLGSGPTIQKVLSLLFGSLALGEKQAPESKSNTPDLCPARSTCPQGEALLGSGPGLGCTALPALLRLVPFVPAAFDLTCLSWGRTALSPLVCKLAAIAPQTPLSLTGKARPKAASRVLGSWRGVGNSGPNQTRSRKEFCPES